MGLLDEFASFAKTPEGIGLLSTVAGGLAGARKGQPINSLGRAGMSGLMGYAQAQDNDRQNQSLELQKSYKTLQEQMIRSNIDKAGRDQAMDEQITDRLSKIGMPQVKSVPVDYTLNPSQVNGVSLNMGEGNKARDDYATFATEYESNVAKGMKPSPDQQMIYEQIKSRVTPVMGEVQDVGNIPKQLRELSLVSAVRKPEFAKTMLEVAKAYEPREWKAGSYYGDSPDSSRYLGDPTKGVTIENGQVKLMPGASSLAALAGMNKRAEAEAGGFDPKGRVSSIYETGIDPVSLVGVGPVGTNGLPKKLQDAQVNSVTAPDAVQQRMGAVSAFDKTIRTAEGILDHPGLSGSVGLRGQIPAIPGTDSANFIAELDTLKSQTFLPMVQQLKGMGALSNAEGEKLTSAIGALDRKMSPDAFRKSVKNIIGDLSEAKQRAAYTGLQSSSQPVDIQSAAQAELARRGIK